MGFFDGAASGLIGGVTGIVGGFLGNDMSRTAADHAADRGDAMAREQMSFQERMSNSAYQRATTDMKAAGINPMVAFQQGGASTPSGAMNSAPMAKVDDVLSKGITSAIDAMKINNELKTGESNRTLNAAIGTKSLADAEASGASAKQSAATTETIKAQMKAIKAEAEARSRKAKTDAELNDYDAIMNRVNRESNSAGEVLNMFKKTQKFPKGSMHIDKDGAILKQY